MATIEYEPDVQLEKLEAAYVEVDALRAQLRALREAAGAMLDSTAPAQDGNLREESVTAPAHIVSRLAAAMKEPAP